MFKKLVALVMTSGLMFGATGQTNITTSNTLTPEQLVTQVLLGAGVAASNITYNGSAVTATTVQASALSYTATGFPFTDGVYLRTQGGASVGYDPDLNAIATNTVTNGGILEFDFVATGDSLSFNYMFASSEYTSYTCSGFNDVFGFFISGPGINGPFSNNGQNLAVVPGTTVPVAINTVNAGAAWTGATANCYAADPNWQANSIYWTTQYGNYSGAGYNGGTVSLSANSDLQCGETYHIKMAISNVGDQALNSGVYLQAGSFTTFPVGFQFNTFTLDNTIYEGCNQLGTLMFTREGCGSLNDPLTAYLSYGGVAINGTDYEMLGDSIYFAPGEDTIFWQIIPYEDFINEGTENILITITTILNTGDTVSSTGTFYISDVPEIIALGQDTLIKCYTDTTEIWATAIGGFRPYEFSWNTGSMDSTATALIPSNGIYEYYVTVTDACGYSDTDTVTVNMNQTLAIDSIIMLTPATCLPQGSLMTTSYPYGATPGNPGQPSSINIEFDWTYAGDTTLNWPDQSSLNNLPGGWYYLTLTDHVVQCTVEDSVFIETVDVPSAQGSVSPDSGCSPVNSVFSNSSQNATDYYWDFGDGQNLNTQSTNDISHTFYAPSNIMLVASNGYPACNDTTFFAVNIVECGCMDPLAINYNPNAVIPTEDCVYPNPEVDAPNVITSDGNNINDIFFLKTKYAELIEFSILNRWGNVIFTGRGDEANPPSWDGKVNGQPVAAGVYFYTYRITGVTGEVVEGQGFVQVIR